MSIHLTPRGLLVAVFLSSVTHIAWADKVPAIRYPSLQWNCITQTCESFACPSDHPNWTGDPVDSQTACDPAFVTYDAMKTVRVSSEAAIRIASASPSVLAGETTETAMRLAKALGEAKTLEQARAIAWEAWRSKVPFSLQRHALVVTRSLAGDVHAVGLIDVMLQALDNPLAELARCHEMARGDSVRKKEAAERLALLLQNPNLGEQSK